jgi:hypothetical protein
MMMQSFPRIAWSLLMLLRWKALIADFAQAAQTLYAVGMISDWLFNPEFRLKIRHDTLIYLQIEQDVAVVVSDGSLVHE